MATIYALENIITGHAYIGVTSGNLAKRLREHRCLCRNKKHHATALSEAWHQYGESSFVMKALEQTDYSHRGAFCAAEQRWIDKYNEQGKLYNGHAKSTGLGGEATRKGMEASRKSIGNRWSEEANEKRRLAQLGKPKGHGAKISAAKRAKQLMR